MQVTSLLSQHEHEHGPECGCGHDHEHSVVHLWQAVLGVVFVLNAFIVDWLFQSAGTLASASAMIGSIILGYPIVVTAVKDLRMGRLSINELVAIAVLAAFASGDYKTAGIVAFFMLTPFQIIENDIGERALGRRRAGDSDRLGAQETFDRGAFAHGVHPRYRPEYFLRPTDDIIHWAGPARMSVRPMEEESIGSARLLALVGAQTGLIGLVVQKLLDALRAAFIRVDEGGLVAFGHKILTGLFPGHSLDVAVGQLGAAQDLRILAK